MKLLRFHHQTKHRQLLPEISQRFIVIVLLCLLSLAATAQSEEKDACIFNTSASISCNKVTIRFGTPTQIGNHFWEFGDGDTSTAPPPVFHDYYDVNPDLSPITATHTFAGNVCQNVVEFPGIFLGTGCGSLRKISEMVAANKLPANELVGKTLYVFGNLEVDDSYTFNACSIFISAGGRITVKSGATLTLKNNTIADTHFISGSVDCQSLWTGIEVFSGGALMTDGATIQNAYFAVRPIQDNPSLFPVLNLKNTNFKRDFVGIYAADGNFVLADFKNNTFEGSGNSPIYSSSTCNQIIGLPFAQRTYCGIYFQGTLGSSLLMPNKSINNVFKNLQAGIICINGTSLIRGCRFENIAFIPNNTALYQGIAITFIDNIGRKALTVVGLGKLGQSTVENCEQGIFATTSKRPSAVNISNCRMVEVQNGIEINASGIGNFTKGTIKDNYIGCTKFSGIIKQRSTGIEWKDPSILLSDFSITDNDIDVDQPEAYPTPTSFDEDILPTGINVIAMHNQASSAGMMLNITNNRIDLIKGHQGIVVENVANATIIGNIILHQNALYSPQAQVGVYVLGGLNNTVNCNFVTQTDPLGAYIVGIACEASPGMTMSQNTIDNTFASIAFVSDNETNCRIQYNDLKYNLGIPGILSTGLYYSDAQTGPQYLQGNDWVGDFVRGALYEQGSAAYSYCNSLYHVSVGANVDNGINPVDQGPTQACGDWLTVLEVGEDDFLCTLASPPLTGIEKNQADLNLAGGGTLSLSPGYKWSAEMGLYRKFIENPDLATGEAIINGFMQTQQSQPVAAMYAVRNGINEIEGNIAPALLSNIQNTLAQLETNETNLLDLLETIDSNPNALASFTSLGIQTEVLDQLLQTYLTSASNSMALTATSVSNTNNNINASGLPCAAERYINGLYLETQVIAPRALTASELEAVQQFGMNCPKDAGNIVYLARAWYYLQTGIILEADCASFMPPLNGAERSTQLLPADSMILMPNPADGYVEINLPARIGEGSILLTDMWGRLVLQHEIPESDGGIEFRISTDDVPNGIYVISAITKSGSLLTRKLTITH